MDLATAALVSKARYGSYRRLAYHFLRFQRRDVPRNPMPIVTAYVPEPHHRGRRRMPTTLEEQRCANQLGLGHLAVRRVLYNVCSPVLHGLNMGRRAFTKHVERPRSDLTKKIRRENVSAQKKAC